MTAHQELSGQIGHYAIIRKLGAGGMGAVYLAEDTVHARRVALKVPHLHLPTRHLIERFKREAGLVVNIAHPNLCPVLGLEEANGVVFFTMPFIEGTPLSRLIEQGKPWPASEAVELVRKVAGAVSHLHAHGIIHRDLKPSNVMVLPSIEPVLMDFGLALDFTSQDPRLTKVGTAIGSPAHMTPEQVGMKRDVGPALDVYGLGLLLYEMVTARLPFEESPPALFMQILREPPPPPSSFNRTLDPRLDALCLKALSKKPEDRQASAAAFATELAALPLEPRSAKSSRAIPGQNKWRMECPKCGKGLRISETYIGRKVRCPKCQSRLGRLQPPSEQLGRPMLNKPTLPDESDTAEMMPTDVMDTYDDSSYGESLPRMAPGTKWLLIGMAALAGLLFFCLLFNLVK